MCDQDCSSPGKSAEIREFLLAGKIGRIQEISALKRTVDFIISAFNAPWLQGSFGDKFFKHINVGLFKRGSLASRET